MNRGLLESSLSAWRSLAMATSRLLSNSTNVPWGQRLSFNSWRETTRPCRSNNATRRRKGWSCNLTSRPRFSNFPDATRASNRPKQKTRPVEADEFINSSLLVGVEVMVARDELRLADKVDS